MSDNVLGALIAVGICVVAGGGWYLYISMTADPVETGPTGAEVGSDLDRILKLQGLKLEDLQANREGRLSPREAERLKRQSRRWSTLMWVATLGVIAVATALAVALYLKNRQPSMFFLPAGGVALAILIYAIWRIGFSPPGGEIAGGKVTPVSGPIENLTVWSPRDGWMVRIHGTTYTSLGALEMGKSLREGETVKAYVLPDSKKLVAIDPM